MIPKGKLYSEGLRGPGDTTEYLPDKYVTTHSADGEIPFGVAVAISEGNKVKVLSSVNDRMIGVAKPSGSGNLDEEKYEDGDVVGVARKDVLAVRLAESVNAGDPVRVAITGPYSGFFGTSAAPEAALIKGLVFKSDGSAGDVAEVWIDGKFELMTD